MSIFYQHTNEVIEQYLSSTSAAHKKLDGSSSGGYVYEKEYNGRTYYVHLRVDQGLEFIMFEVYPGLMLLDTMFMPAVAKYCQQITPVVGSLQIETEHLEIYYHAETPFIDASIEEATIIAFEQEAFALLDAHYETLKYLCRGQFPDTIPSDDSSELVVRINTDSYADESIEAIETYLSEESGHNIIARNLNSGSDQLFMSEILVSGDRYVMHIDISPDKAFLSIKMYHGTGVNVIDRAYRHLAARYCNEKSDEKKVGFLCIGNDLEGPYCKINVSLLDGTITGKTIDEIEHILISFVHNSMRELDFISNGFIAPPLERSENPTPDGQSPAAQQISSMISSSSSDNDSSDSEPSSPEAPPSGGMASQLKGLQSMLDSMKAHKAPAAPVESSSPDTESEEESEFDSGDLDDLFTALGDSPDFSISEEDTSEDDDDEENS